MFAQGIYSWLHSQCVRKNLFMALPPICRCAGCGLLSFHDLEYDDDLEDFFFSKIVWHLNNCVVLLWAAIWQLASTAVLQI